MKTPESRRTYQLLLACLLLADTGAFVPSRSASRRGRQPPSVLCDTNESDSLTIANTIRQEGILSRRMVSSSTEVSSVGRVDDVRQLEKQIVRLGRAGKTDEAIALYRSIDSPRVTIRVLNGVLDACSRGRPTRVDQAFEIFKEAIATDGKSSHLRPNVFTFGALMNACKQARDSTRALQLLQSMQVRKRYRSFVDATMRSSDRMETLCSAHGLIIAVAVYRRNTESNRIQSSIPR